jgi:outer membrane protein OmpA-like peptidoglycan-associated protein
MLTFTYAERSALAGRTTALICRRAWNDHWGGKDMLERRYQARLVGALAAGAVLFTGCAQQTQNRDRGAVIGAAVGGAVGGVVGNQTGSTARGAIIGAVVGGAAGAIIGHQMDQQAKEIEQTVPGATVQRVEEGIAVTFASGLLFDFDSDRIRAQAAENLRSLANSLGQYPNTDLLVVGHTDSVGTASYNQGLSERRARATVDYLASLGVSRTRMRALGRGEDEPIAANASAEGRQQNRRVEIAIVANEAARQEAERRARQP